MKCQRQLSRKKRYFFLNLLWISHCIIFNSATCSVTRFFKSCWGKKCKKRRHSDILGEKRGQSSSDHKKRLVFHFTFKKRIIHKLFDMETFKTEKKKSLLRSIFFLPLEKWSLCQISRFEVRMLCQYFSSREQFCCQI